MIKYIGSKRRLVPVLGGLLSEMGAVTALDLFTGTTRVAQELKRRGARVTAVDSARYSDVFARCYIAADSTEIDHLGLTGAVDHLNGLAGQEGYFTETFCRQSRYLRPENGARVDAIRDTIESEFAGSPLHPLLLTSLIEAADRVDSTVGVQMAYLKAWAARAHRPLTLRVPELLAGGGDAVRGDACELAGTLGPFDLAYLDPPYNQHRYFSNYHVWETLVAWDAPEHFGTACKRVDVRLPETKSAFNSRRTMAPALARVIADVDARVVVVSYNDEAWVTLDELVEMCSSRGHVEVLAYDSRRYVGAQIGVYNPQGQRVGEATRLRNVEYVVICGDRADVVPLAESARPAGPPLQPGQPVLADQYSGLQPEQP